jgi:glutamine amidotransferase
MVATTAISPREMMTDAPRSLRALSREHPDGWGIALHDTDWTIERDTSCADACARFATLADRPGHVIIAHVRKATVGPVSLDNTHPFRRGRFVFAHNGTLDPAPLAPLTAPEHLAGIAGDTDSERLFAFLLTQIDATGSVARGLAAAVAVIHGVTGTANFLLSCGEHLYAHRFGRSLFVAHRAGVALVASEPLTDEPWHELPDRTLLELEPRAPAALAA